MKCPFCKTLDTSVKDSREAENGSVIRRRRECNDCNKRFTTFEKIHLREIVVIKRSGLKRPFDRLKILKSISTALRKRSFSDEDIEKLANRICLELESANEKEIQSKIIGQIILQELAKIDQVAYIRFASVYKDFTSIQDFVKFISNIKKVKLK